MEELDKFHDEVAMEIDKRKIQKLIDEGVIDPEEFRNAPIIELIQTCACKDTEPNEANLCIKCLAKYDEKDITDEIHG